MKDDFVRTATCLRVIDGDTYELRIDLGYRVEGRFIIRLRDFNAAELPTSDGVHAKRLAERLLANGVIRVRSYKDQQSFARWIADISVDDVDLKDLLRQAHEAESLGGGSEPVAEGHGTHQP